MGQVLKNKKNTLQQLKNCIIRYISIHFILWSLKQIYMFIT